MPSDSFPRICYRWGQTVRTKSNEVKLVTSFLKDRTIVLRWDRKRFLYLSDPAPTPCGRHSARLLIDGNLYPCDSFTVTSLMFEVPVYTQDSSSDEETRPILQPAAPLRSVYFSSQLPTITRTRTPYHVPQLQFGDLADEEDGSPKYKGTNFQNTLALSNSLDSGIQDMTLDMKLTTENHAASTMMDDGTPNHNLNRSQSTGSLPHGSGIGSIRSSTPVHRSFEKLVVLMPAEESDDENKRQKRSYVKRSVEIERNIEKSLTRVTRSVAVVKGKEEVSRASEEITEVGPDSVGLESTTSVVTVQLRDEESQTGGGDESPLARSLDETFDGLEAEMIPVVEELVIQELKPDLEPESNDECVVEERYDSEDNSPVLVVEGEALSPIPRVVDETLNPILLITDVDLRIDDSGEYDAKGTIGVEGVSEKEVVEADNERPESVEVIKERVSAREQQVRRLQEEILTLEDSHLELYEERDGLLTATNHVIDGDDGDALLRKLDEDRRNLSQEVESLRSQVTQQERSNNNLEWEVKTLRTRLDANDPGEVNQLIEEMRVLREELLALTSKNRDLYTEIVELREENTFLKKSQRHLALLPTSLPNQEIPGRKRTVKAARGLRFVDDGSANSAVSASSSDGTEYRDVQVDQSRASNRSLGVQTAITALEKEAANGECTGGCSQSQNGRRSSRRGERQSTVKEEKKSRHGSATMKTKQRSTTSASTTKSSTDSGSSTDSLLEEADKLIKESMHQMLGRDCGERKKSAHRPPKHQHQPQHVVTRSGTSSVCVHGTSSPSSSPTTADGDYRRTVSYRLPGVRSRLLPFIPKTRSDLEPGCGVKFIHPIFGGVTEGHVRYLGPIDAIKPGDCEPNVAVADFVGVELMEPVGNCDGCLNGKRFFECENNKGLFIPTRKIILAWRMT